MIDVNEICNSIHQQILGLERLLRYVNSQNFRTLYVRLPEKDQQTVCRLLKTGKYVDVATYMRNTRVHQLPLSRLTVRELRRLAAQHKIPNYTHLHKEVLIAALEESNA